jgi:hypothetical protein
MREPLSLSVDLQTIARMARPCETAFQAVPDAILKNLDGRQRKS